MKRLDNKIMSPSVNLLKLFSVLLISILVVSVAPEQCFSAAGDYLDSYPYQHVLTGKQQAEEIAVDPNGFIVIGGSTGDDFLTLKVAADGSAKLWEKTFDQGGGVDHLEDVVIDSNGDVIVTGYASAGVNGYKDIITIKYAGADGTELWQVSYNNSASDGDDFPFALAVDSLNNIYVAGKTQNAGGDDDGLVLKYSPDGANPDGSPIWVRTYDGPGTSRNDQWVSVAAGSTGVAVTGTTDAEPAPVPDPANFDIVTMLYNQDGTDGWGAPVVFDSGVDGDSGLFVAMDSNEDVIITGISGANSGDFYTVKYNNANGAINTSWSTAKTYDGGSIDEPKGLWIDGNDDVYVTGSTFKVSSTDYYTIRYNGSDGSSAWGGGAIFNSGLDQADIPVGIVVDDAGDVFVTGHTVLSGTDYDFTTIKYRKENGTQLWSSPVGVFSGAAGKRDQPVGLGLASTGELFVGGWTDTAADDYDFVAIKYDPGNLNAPTSLSATTISNTEVDLSWTDNANNESGFKIFRKKASDLDFTEIDTVAANITTYSDSGLTPHIWYTYKVQAYITSPASVSHFTNEANALTTLVSYDTPSWIYQYDSPDNGEDYAYAIAVGPDEHPVATGTHQPGVLPAPVSFDYYTVKMDRSNATKIWDATYNNADDQLDIADCITVDTNNDVIVSGFSNLPWGLNSNTNDIYTRKYLSTGPDNGPPNFGDPYVWSAQYNGPDNDDDRSEAIDASSDGDDNIVVTGYGKNTNGDDDIYLIKYDAPGDGLGEGNTLWAATPYDGGGNDYPAAVVFDQNGDVIFTGQSFLSGNEDIFTRKVDGTNGNTIWTAIYNGTGNGYDAGFSLAVDSNGDVFVTGATTNASGDVDWYIVKYDGDTTNPNGAVLWSTTHDGPDNGNDFPETVKVDPNDDAVVIGGTVLQSVVDNVDNNDFHLRRYMSDGTPDWNRTLERISNDDNATTMGMDISGNVCLAGNTDDADSIDLLAVKYDYAGNLIGGTLFDGVDDTDAHAMAVNTLGDQFIAGYTTPRQNLDSDFLVVNCMGDVLQSPYPVTTTVHYTSVDFNWADNSPDEDGFYLERKVGDCASVDWDTGSNLIHTAAAGATSYTDEGLNIGSTYCYRIQTFKNSGATSRWLEKEVTTTNPLPPDGLQASVLNTTEIKLEWNDNTSTEDGFLIERCTGEGCDPAVGPNKKIFDIEGDNESFIDTSACYNTTYNYHIKAYRTGKWSTLYVDFTADLTTDNLSPPTLLVKKDFDQNTIYLEWNDNSDDETSFVVERCTGQSCSNFSDLSTVTTIYGNVLLLGMNEVSWAGSPTTDEAIDSSGNTNHGTAFGGANTGADGVYDRRAELDGTNDYLTTPLTIDQSATSAGATMMAWVYPASTSANNHYLFSTESETAGSENYNWGVYRNGGTWYVDTGSGTTSTGVTVTPGEWKHIAVVFDPAGIRFYINGAETAMAVPGSNDTSQPFTIGRRGVQNGEYFDGYLDEVAVYDRPLSLVQVQALMNDSVFESGKARYVDSSGISYDAYYTYRVRAEKTTDASCTWDPAPTNELEINTLPPPPDNLQATVLDSTRVWLTWDDKTAGEDTFTLERCVMPACSPFSTVSDTIPADSTSYVDTTACGGTNYRYQIKAVNPAWTSVESLPSNSADVTTHDKGLQPTSLTVTGQLETQVDLQWNYAATDLTGFRIGICQGAQDPSGTCDIAADPLGDYGYPGSPYTSAPVLPSGVIAWWKFDEPFYDGTAGEVIDSSVVGNNATTVNGPTIVTPGKYGYGAISFDGVNDYITTNIDIDQDSSASPGVTFEAWVNSNPNSTGDRYLISTANDTYDWSILQSTNTWFITNGSNFVSVGSGARSGWQHIAAVFIPGTGVTFYKNGVENAKLGISYDTSDATLTIGRAGSITNRYFWGEMDEVVVYDRPLSAQEIQDRYNQNVHFSVNGLSNTTDYNFSIWPYKSASCSWDGPNSSVAFTTTDDISNVAPTNFNHTYVNTTRVDLVWDDIASSETGYRLQRCLGDLATTCSSDSNFTVDWYQPPNTNDTAYSDETVCQGQTYTYRIRAEGTDGGINSLWAYHEVTTTSSTAPGLTLNVLSESEIDVLWADTNFDEEQIVIKRCDDVGANCTLDADFNPTPLVDNIIDNGKLLHFRMDEPSWNNSAGDVLDTSGYNYHGTPYNDATTVDSGKYDRAGDFNGSNKYVVSTLNIDQSSSSTGVTLEAWVRPTINDANYRHIISTDNGGYDWGILILADTFYVSTGENWRSTGVSITLNEWQHVAAVFDPVAGNVKFYKDGAVTPATVNYLAYDTSDSNVTVGRYGSSTAAQYHFQGQIDEVVVYDHPLPQSEIENHYLLKVDQVSFKDTGLTPGAFYTYRIQAIKSSPSCSWTTETIDTAQTDQPPAPTGLSVGGDTTTAALVWNDNSGSETGYRLQRCTGGAGVCDPDLPIGAPGDPWTTEWMLDPDTESYDDTTVCPGNTFSYRVRAEKSTGPSWVTTWDSAVGVIPTPLTPSGLNFTKVSEVQVNLGWNDETTDESGFTIEQCAGASCPATGVISYLSVSPDETSYQAIALTPDQPYTFRIRADKASAACGWPTSYSSEVSTDTFPYVPTGLNANATSTTDIEICWNDNTASETGTEIWRCDDPPGCTDGYSLVGTVEPGETCFTDTTTCSNQQYSYQVRAIGNGLSNSGGGCWTKKAPITFTNGFQANSPVEIVIPYATFAPDMQADYRDIRFYDATAKQELNKYWFADKVDGNTARVWIMTGDYDNIYLYYGNVLASDSSGTDALFTRLYDDFAGTVIDTAKWVELDRPENYIQQNDGLKLIDPNSANRLWNKAIISAESFERAVGNEILFDFTFTHVYRRNYTAIGWGKDQVTSTEPSELMHGLYFKQVRDRDAHFELYENDAVNSPTTIPGPYIMFNDYNIRYEVKIILKEPGAQYYIKGGLYTDWTLIHETSTAFSGDENLRIAMMHNRQTMTFHSVSIKHASSQRGATIGAISDVGTCTGDFNIWQSLYNDNGPVTITADNFADPDTLVLEIISDTSVALNWNSNTSDENGFKIERCLDTGSGCFFVEIDTTGTGITTYLDTTVPASSTVSYQVKAYKTTPDCNWISGPSNAPTVVMAASAPSGPDTPTELKVTPLNSFKLQLEWVDNGADEEGYEIEVQTFNGSYANIAVLGANTQTYVDCKAEPDKTYHYRVRSYRGTAKSDWLTGSGTTPPWADGDSTDTCDP